MHLWAFSALLLKFEYEIAIAVFECYDTHPIVSWEWGLCLWIALSSLVMNIHNPFMRCVTSQYVFRTAWRHNAAACGHNDNNLAAASSATPSPSPVSLNGVFHQDFSTQQRKLRIWKICNAKYIKLTRHKSHLNSVYTKCVCNKSESARVCAKWPWNALDWC